MITSPNAKYAYNERSGDYYSLGNNNFKRKFRWPFDILLTTDYFAGSDYGKIFNERRMDGKSQIYVDQEKIEEQLQNDFLEGDEDKTKFLVGPLGVGKTTLLRNFFKVFGREVVDDKKGNLIIYVSLYSMVSADMCSKEEKLMRTMANAIGGAITYLSGKSAIERIQSYDSIFYDDFYHFIEYHSSYLIEDYRQSPSEKRKETDSERNRAVLSWLYEKNYFEYQLCLLKYYLSEQKRENPIKNVILLVDDMESLSLDQTSRIIDIVYMVRKCLEAVRIENEKDGCQGGIKKREYNVKVLVSLRNYSIRNINRERQDQAFRVTENDIILKDKGPSLKEVLTARINYLMNRPEIINMYSNRDAFDQAVSTLNAILDSLYHQYDNMILSLTHNNIFVGMQLVLRIVTNKQFIGYREYNRGGAFKIKSDTYISKIGGAEGLKNDDVFYALVYGEGKAYIDKGDYYLTNILHYKNREGVNTKLLGLFIIQFMKQRDIVFGDPNHNLEKAIEGREVIDSIINLFDLAEYQTQGIISGLELMMKHLYEGGALLQSVVDPSYEDANVFRRVYHKDMRVFLSNRGLELYKMLSRNSLLLEIYRDDIDTDITGNEVLTINLSKRERFIYCLRYIEELYYSEVSLFRRIKNKRLFRETLGNVFPTVLLLEGMRQSIDNYYRRESDQKEEVFEMYNTVAMKVREMVADMNEGEQYSFESVHLL